MPPVCNKASFRAEARYQVVCAYCGKARPFHAHHAVDKAELEKTGLTGKLLYDTRNALRLCNGPTPGTRCHLQFENRRIVITTKMLTDDNIEYAFEKLGASAADYLRREYDDVANPDPRIEIGRAHV